MEKISEGRTAEVYDYAQNQVLKLYQSFVPNDAIQYEYNINQLVSLLPVNCPKVFNKIEQEDRTGIVFEKINGISMLHAMMKPEHNVQQLANIFADLHIQLHQAEIEKESIPQYKIRLQKELLTENILNTELLTLEEKESILAKLATLEEDNRLCHGDYHPDNVLLGENNWIIDWMTGNIGHPLGDIARTIIIIRYAIIPIELPNHLQILINQQRENLLQYYLIRYFAQTDYSMHDIEKWMLPIAAARLLEPIPESEKKVLLEFVHERLSQEL